MSYGFNVSCCRQSDQSWLGTALPHNSLPVLTTGREDSLVDCGNDKVPGLGQPHTPRLTLSPALNCAGQPGLAASIKSGGKRSLKRSVDFLNVDRKIEQLVYITVGNEQPSTQSTAGVPVLPAMRRPMHWVYSL